MGKRKRQQRVKGSDKGKGAAKRKRQQRVKGSDMGKGVAKRKCYSSPPVKSKGCSASDSDVSSSSIRMKGLSASDSDVSSSSIEMKGLSDSDDVSSSSIEMKGWSDSDDVASSSVEMKGWSDSDDVSSPSLESKGCSANDGDDVSSPSLEIKGCSARDSDVSPRRKRVESIGCSANDGEPGVSEDELPGQLLGDLEKVQYFGTTASGDDEQELQRTKNLSHSAFPDMKQSDCKEFDVKNLAEIFKLQGNKAMQSKLYPAAIECYNVAIALGGDDAIYYCNRAAAYIQTCQYAEAILDCQKSIAIDPNYIKAYTRLGYIYFVQGIDALEKGYRIATLLDPTNESVRENVRAAEHKIWQQREESGQTSNWSYSNGVMSVRDQVPSPLFGNNSGAGLRASAMGPADTNPGELYAAIRAAYQLVGGVAPQDNNSDGN